MDVAARYQTVKRHIVERIAAGEWPPGARIPSENELVDSLGISRMTVNRAVRELASEGRVVRLVGVGTFVAEPRPEAASMPLASIRDWIARRGGRHSWRTVETARFGARPELAKLYDLAPGTPLAFALLLHAENGAAIQLEERFVNLDAAPDFAGADLGRSLPDDVLAGLLPDGTSLVTVEAIRPSGRVADLLRLQAEEPCLLVTRRLEAKGAVASIARLIHPGSRFRLESD
jgi:GntR family transcriptional regulator, histidine utilization repressor